MGTGPGGIAVDGAGNIYVADTWNHRIQKFDKDGKFVTKWGSFINLADNAVTDPNQQSMFFGPRGVAIGPDGNVYVTDTGNKRIATFTPDGKFVREITSGVNADKTAHVYRYDKEGEMNEPIGLAVDKAGNIFVADVNNRRIQKFDPTGKFAAQWPIPAGSWDPGPYLEPFLALDAGGECVRHGAHGQGSAEVQPHRATAGPEERQRNDHAATTHRHHSGARRHGVRGGHQRQQRGEPGEDTGSADCGLRIADCALARCKSG